MDEHAGRRIDERLEIAAPPAQVWKALSEAEQLIRWFAPRAEVEPGAGGSVRLSWDTLEPGDKAAELHCQIELWEPEKCLRLVSELAPGFQMVVEYRLEGRGGHTLLRLVHSGFGSDADWDDEFDTTQGGWRFFLRALRYYLLHQFGRRRSLAWGRVVSDLPREEIWSRLMGPGGLNSPHAAALAEDDRFELRTPDGDVFAGKVFVCHPPIQFGGQLEGFGEGHLLFEVEPQRTAQGARRYAPSFWISSFTADPAEIAAVQTRCRRWLAALFASPGDSR